MAIRTTALGKQNDDSSNEGSTEEDTVSDADAGAGAGPDADRPSSFEENQGKNSRRRSS